MIVIARRLVVNGRLLRLGCCLGGNRRLSLRHGPMPRKQHNRSNSGSDQERVSDAIKWLHAFPHSLAIKLFEWASTVIGPFPFIYSDTTEME